MARPSSLLELPNIVEKNIEFKLNKNESKRVADFTLKYIVLRGKGKDEAVKGVAIGLKAAVRVIQTASHPFIFVEENAIKEFDITAGRNDIDDFYQQGLEVL